MGMISLPSLDAILQIKDPNKRFEELVNTMGILIKNLSEINGYLTAKNIRASSITADRMKVDELSAITANIGHVTAGIIETVTMISSEIYGSYIATADGTYPRAEMSNTLNIFAAFTNALRSVSIEAFNASLGSPGVVWRDNGQSASGELSAGRYTLSSDADAEFGSTNNVFITAGGDISITPFIGDINIPDWNTLYNSSSGRTLQQDLNSKANTFFGFSGSFDTGDGRVATFSNGICTSVV